jgi:hypothetical protein
MTNFRAALITFLALIDNGTDADTAQDIVYKRFRLDDDEAAGLFEELETMSPEQRAELTGGDPNARRADFEIDGDDDYVPNDEPNVPHDLSDDAEALASIGWGTDEDYGYYGGDEY